jgi:2-polyprenyl-3-methyl-5-hydroxy-6-metoxy-1,4-benzoquinol methylase
MTQELQRHAYQVTLLEPLNDGYIKDQQYPFLFDIVVVVEVIEHLPNVWEELEHIEKVLEPVRHYSFLHQSDQSVYRIA